MVVKEVNSCCGKCCEIHSKTRNFSLTEGSVFFGWTTFGGGKSERFGGYDLRRNGICLFLQTHHFGRSEIDRFYTALGSWKDGRRTDAGRAPEGHRTHVILKMRFFKTPSKAEIRKKGSKGKLSRLLSWSQRKSLPAVFWFVLWNRHQKKALLCDRG